MKSVPLPDIVRRSQNLKIGMGVEPGNEFAVKRVDMVNVVPDSGCGRESLGLHVEHLDKSHVRPSWSLLYLVGLMPGIGCIAFGATFIALAIPLVYFSEVGLPLFCSAIFPGRHGEGLLPRLSFAPRRVSRIFFGEILLTPFRRFFSAVVDVVRGPQLHIFAMTRLALPLKPIFVGFAEGKFRKHFFNAAFPAFLRHIQDYNRLPQGALA